MTGGSGQVGSAAARLLAHVPEVQILRPHREILPLDRPLRLRAVLGRLDPALILHLGAFTAVDRAELEPNLAFRVNRDATATLASWCAAHQRPLLYVSTDFVFDGNPPPGRPHHLWLRHGYEPEDPPCPQNVYGASKLAGEIAVRSQVADHWIVRTSWVFGAGAPNFPTAILQQAARRTPLRVVADQVGRPTYAPDLAHALVYLVGLGSAAAAAPYGTYHVAGAGTASWYDVAVEILKRSAWAVAVEPIAAQDYPAPAVRPARSVLSTRSAAAVGVRLGPWRSGVSRFVAAMAELRPDLVPAYERR